MKRLLRRIYDRLGARGALLLGACLALALSFAEPGARLPRERFDHVVVLDITQSMNTQDVEIAGRPASRLAYARHALRQALPRLSCGSRLGFGIFTEYRVLLLFAPVEVCANYGELVAALQRIDGRMAWAGASEVAKGLYSGMRSVQALADKPSLVFITDGHEAPPVNPKLRPQFDGAPGVARGVIVGVGGDTPSPIPKFDPDGKPLGFWGPDEVAQTDVFSRGRSGSVGGEGMVGAQPDRGRRDAAAQEHLSSLKESYLRQLALETGLGYQRLDSPAALHKALTSPALARRAEVHTDLRFVAAGVALALLLLAHLPLPRSRSAIVLFAPSPSPGLSPAGGEEHLASLPPAGEGPGMGERSARPAQ